MKSRHHIVAPFISFLVVLFGFTQTAHPLEKRPSTEAVRGADPSRMSPLEPCREQIDITSDQMIADYKRTSVTFRGHVRAVQCDLVLTADELTAEYGQDGASIATIVALGDVKVLQGDRMARGEEAVFQGEDRTITLVGSPVLAQGKNEIRGEKIVVYIDEGRMDIEGGVNAVLYPAYESE